jgi:hypothetical protein
MLSPAVGYANRSDVSCRLAIGSSACALSPKLALRRIACEGVSDTFAELSFLPTDTQYRHPV